MPPQVTRQQAELVLVSDSAHSRIPQECVSVNLLGMRGGETQMRGKTEPERQGDSVNMHTNDHIFQAEHRPDC